MENLLADCSFWTIFGAVCVTKWYTPPEALCVGSSAYLNSIPITYMYLPSIGQKCSPGTSVAVK